MQRQPMQHEPDALLTLSQAAQLAGVNKSTLSRQVKAGLIRSHQGKVRLSEVLEDRERNVDLTRSRRRQGKLDAVDEAVASAPGATRARATKPAPISQPPSLYTDARSRKEDATARLRQLEFDREVGKLVDIDEVGRQVEREYAVVRERLLAIPGKLAAKLVGLDRAAIDTALSRRSARH